MQVSFGLSAAGLQDPAFWALFAASAERKLLSGSGKQLAWLLTGIGRFTKQNGRLSSGHNAQSVAHKLSLHLVGDGHGACDAWALND